MFRFFAQLAVLNVAALICCTNMLAAEPLFRAMPGMVSYTYRNELAADMPGTLDLIKDLGITDMEFSNLFERSPAEIRQMLDERDMICSSFGTSYDDIRNKTELVASHAKTLGAKFIRVAWLPGRQPFTLALAEQTAAEFNEIGRTLRTEHGLTFCYHNHGYEFVPYENGTLFDVLMAKTNPEDVSIELDILWAFLPGADPAGLLKTYGDRIKLMHLKDLRHGVEGNLLGKTPVENDVALGTGQLDLPTILQAAKEAGVQHYYIEDESPSIATQVPQSIKFLKSLNVSELQTAN